MQNISRCSPESQVPRLLYILHTRGTSLYNLSNEKLYIWPVLTISQVSAPLHSAFKTFISTPSQRFLLATIEDEAVALKTVIDSSNGKKNDSFACINRLNSDIYLDNSSSLKSHLSQTEPLYILARKTSSIPTSTSDSTNSSDSDFLAITYIPDNAPVRPKTLFASTRLTLVRELGQDRFSSTELVNTADEVLEAATKVDGDSGSAMSSSKGGIGKGTGANGADQPLTESERALEEIKRAEAKVSVGTGARSAHVSSGLQIPVDGDVVDALRALKASGDDREEEGNGVLVQLVLIRPFRSTVTSSESSARIC